MVLLGRSRLCLCASCALKVNLAGLGVHEPKTKSKRISYGPLVSPSVPFEGLFLRGHRATERLH